MDSTAFLARVEEYHKAGWRLALINATTVMARPAAPAPETPSGPEAPGRFEVAWAFAKGAQFETIREEIAAGDEVPSISEFFGAAFLYENEIRELFGIKVTGMGLDLKGQLYKTATKVPFSHAAVKARLAAVAAATVKS
jgi:NADH:ubiquinone oxidoreductase subunit C